MKHPKYFVSVFDIRGAYPNILWQERLLCCVVGRIVCIDAASVTNRDKMSCVTPRSSVFTSMENQCIASLEETTAPHRTM